MELKLNKDQVEALYQMVWIMSESPHFTHPVEPIILNEIQDVIEKKLHKTKVKLQLLASQFLVLFVKLNHFEFEHPYHRTVAINIVWQIDMQRINNSNGLKH